MDCFKNRKSLLALVVTLVLIISMSATLNSMADSSTDNVVFKKTKIYIGSAVSAIITNEEGETIIIDENGILSGTMPILEEERTEGEPSEYILVVRSSDSYTYEQKEKGYNRVSFLYNDYENMGLVCMTDVGKAVINILSATIDLSGETQNIKVESSMGTKGYFYTVKELMKSDISMVQKDGRAVVTGVQGKAEIEVEDFLSKERTKE